MWLWSGSENRVKCFYCNAKLALVPPVPSSAARSKGKQRATEDGYVAVGTKHDFWCAECGQITRTDQHGEIMSDEAAHHDASLNSDSFALRGTPSKDRIPTPFPTPATTPFCRQCLSNQALQLHLLASYPIDETEDDDRGSGGTAAPPRDYPPLDEYRHSLDLRYPLVCATCAPAIESTIRERDYRVKAQALGWRLRESQKRRELEERRSEEARRREGRAWLVQGAVWHFRGAAWLATHSIVMIHTLNPRLPLDFRIPSISVVDQLASATGGIILVLVALLSLFWSFWDPTWNSARLERARGRDLVSEHRALYLGAQMLAYVSRLALAVDRAAQTLRLDTSARGLAEHSACFLAFVALVSASYIPTVRTRDAPRLVSRSPNGRHKLSNLITADPLEPLAHLSLSHDGSLLAPSPPATPTSHDRLARTARGKSDERVRRGSFPSLFRTRQTGTSTPPRLRTFATSELSVQPVQSADADHTAASAEEPMDWCPTPPQQASSGAPNSFDSPLALCAGSLSSSSGNHITFARQRFVPPDTRKPTGLEGMFERVVAVQDVERDVLTETAAGQDVEMMPPQGSWTWVGWWR